MKPTMKKYPRTPHLQGSRLQPGDEDLRAVPFADIAGKPLVVEEKIDGANSALSFDDDGTLFLQSRGHYLTGGPRERQFDLFKTWATAHSSALRERLGSRYVVYGEWAFAKHTVFYDLLPHYFLEFDILDRDDGGFLATEARRELLEGLAVVSVPVLHIGPLARLEDLTSLVGPSVYKSEEWRDNLRNQASKRGLDVERAVRETDNSDASEGLYVKVEELGRVTARYKWVRHGFLQAVQASDSHWFSRPILPNLLAPDVDFFA